MNEIGFVFIDAVGVILSLIILLIMIAMFGWFGWAVGGAIGETIGAEDSGGFFGMLIGVAVCLALLFFV